MSNFQILRYEPGMRASWDEFVESSRNGTIFHTQLFISYHPPSRFEDCSLIFTSKNRMRALFPAAIRQSEDGKRVLFSHPGTTYGGLVIPMQMGLSEVTQLVEELLSFAGEMGLDAVQMRLSPTAFHKYPCQELDFVLPRLGFQMIDIELSSAVSLVSDQEQLWKMFRSDTARSIRKAINEERLTVRISEDWKEYWQILEDNLDARHQTTPTHSLEEIQRLKQLFPERVFLQAGYLEEKMTAGAVVFLCNEKALHTFYMAQDYDNQHLRALNLVLYRIMQWGQERRCGYLNLGISTEDSGRSVNWGLFHFKEGFGARGVARRLYRKEIVHHER